MNANDAVIVAAARTPIGIGKADRGVLSGLHPVELSAVCLRGLVERAGIEPVLVDDVIWGCVSQVGEQSFNVGRNAALAAGFPDSVPGTTVDRQCGSSQQAIQFAAASVIAGHQDIVVAGGVESMSRVPMFANTEGGEGPFGPTMRARFDLVTQGVSAERIAERWQLGRGRLDELAVASHERAARATKDGLFSEEIVPVVLEDRTVVEDQGIRPGTNADSLAALRTPFAEDGVVTAGNASQVSDGAAAVLVMTSERARQLNLQPLARVHSVAVCGVDPVIMLTGPIPATRAVLSRAGLELADIGAFEINEAFASVSGAWLAETGADESLTNPLGGAIALGHPLGGSGARLTTTLVHHLRREGIRYGLQSMCEGGGMANAMILENVG